MEIALGGYDWHDAGLSTLPWAWEITGEIAALLWVFAGATSLQRSRKLRPQHVPEDGSFTIGRFVGEVLAVLLDVGRLDL